MITLWHLNKVESFFAAMMAATLTHDGIHPHSWTNKPTDCSGHAIDQKQKREPKEDVDLL